LLALAATGIVALLLWDSMFLWPFKILVVLFHELGHALAAVLTGGEVVEITLSPNQGGLTKTIGGFRFIILNAGYLASLATGVSILALARNPKRAPFVAWGLAAVALITSVLYIPLISFGFAFALLAAVAFALMAKLASAGITQWFLRAIGVFSVLYALFDIRDDVFRVGSGAVTDATMLADLTFIPSYCWGASWLVAGVVILFLLRRWWV
jgi:hypothetical protein